MAKHFILNGLTITDLSNMEVALRLRLEAAEENHDKEWIETWMKLHDKVLRALARVGKIETSHLKGCFCWPCQAKNGREKIRGKNAEEEKRSRKK